MSNSHFLVKGGFILRLMSKFFRLILILFMISLLSFFLSNISSIDSAETIAHHLYGNPSSEQIEKVRIEKGLDKPIFVQYTNWLKMAVTGNLGTSYQTSNPVVKILGNHYPCYCCTIFYCAFHYSFKFSFCL